MKKCPNCGEEIQEEAKKCKHCKEWLTKPTISDTKNSKKWYKKWWGILIIIFLSLYFLGLVSRCTKGDVENSNLGNESSTSQNQRKQTKEDNNETEKSSGSNDSYFAGYTLGSTLASQHYAYNGDLLPDNWTSNK